MFHANFYLICVIVLSVIIPLFLYRTVRGPNVFDRLIGLNGIATKAILLLVLIGALDHQIDMFIDIAIGYGLINLVGSLAVAKYLEKKQVNA